MMEVSSLYARYNGFMLGLFFDLLTSPGRRLRRVQMKRRICDFLADVGVSLKVRPVAGISARDRTRLRKRLDAALGRVDGELVDFFAVGSACARIVAEGDPKGDLGGDIIVNLYEYVDHNYEFGPGFLNATLNLPSDASLTDLAKPALEVIEAALKATPVESLSCFVALPFEHGYYEMYRRVISPALREARLRPIVAWGNIEAEEYQEVLFSLIRRCGRTLAVVTENNPNVLMELGYASGCGRKTLPVVAQGYEAASNIRRADLVTYDPKDRTRANRILTQAIADWADA